MARDFVNRVVELFRLIGRRALLGRKLCARLALDLKISAYVRKVACSGHHHLRRDKRKKETYGNLEIDKLFGKCAHLVAEAKRVLANLLRRKSKVALALLFALQDDLVLGSLDKVVNIKRAAGLDLDSASVCRVP